VLNLAVAMKHLFLRLPLQLIIFKTINYLFHLLLISEIIYLYFLKSRMSSESSSDQDFICPSSNCDDSCSINHNICVIDIIGGIGIVDDADINTTSDSCSNKWCECNLQGQLFLK
jgi:hypothetical protein